MIGHGAANVPAGAEVVYSTAVPPDNPERRGRRAGASFTAPICWPRSPRCAAASPSPAPTARRRRRRWSCTSCAAAGCDPSYVVGGELRATGAQRRLGDGGVDRGRGRRVRPLAAASCDPEIAVLTNAELDHHSTYGSRLDLDGRPSREFMARAGEPRGRLGPPRAPGAVPGGRDPYDAPEPVLSPAGSRFGWRGLDVAPDGARAPTTRSTPPARSTRLRARRRRPAAGGGGARRLPRRRGGASSCSGRRRRARPSTTTTPTTRPRSRRRSPPRGRWRRARRDGGLPAAPVLAHAGAAREFGAALARADVVVVLDVYPARERRRGLPGGRRAAVGRRGRGRPPAGGPVAWLPELRRGAGVPRRRPARRATLPDDGRRATSTRSGATLVRLSRPPRATRSAAGAAPLYPAPDADVPQGCSATTRWPG